MAFVVETGTGVANANSYTSVATYRAYFADRGVDVSAETDEDIQARLVRATDFVEKRFGQQWKGARATLVQALGFPRTGVVVDGRTLASNIVPMTLQFGVCEYGARAKRYAELAPDTPVPFARETPDGSAVPAAGVVVAESKRVGPIEKSVEYADPTAASNDWAIPQYPAADALILPLVAGGRSGRTIRA